MSVTIKSGAGSNLATVDTRGNLQVLSTPAALAGSSDPWTSGTLLNAAQVLMDNGGFISIIVQVNQTNITGGAIVFEGTYDGINWIALPNLAVLNPATYLATPSNPYVLETNSNVPFLLLVSGFQQVRVRLSTVITGVGQIQFYWTQLAYSPIPNSNTVIASNLRQPKVFHSTQATTAGTTPVWTPESGYAFRLLRYMIEGTLNMSQAAQGVLTVSFQDGTNPTPFEHDVYVPSTSLRTNVAYSTGWIDLGGTGFLSVAANNVLNVNLSSALTAGNFRVIVCGQEE